MDSDGFMRRAIALSRAHMAANAGGPFGAVIVKDGRIIAEGWNQVTSTNDPTAHAEMVAIRHACTRLGTFRLDDCEIYTSCEPCPMCLSAVYWARLKALYYGNSRSDAAAIGFDDALIYDQVALPIDRRTIPMRQLLAGEANTVFQDWAAKPDKVRY